MSESEIGVEKQIDLSLNVGNSISIRVETFLQKYCMSVNDILVENLSALGEVLKLIRSIIVSKYHLKANEKKISFESKLSRFTYLFNYHYSDFYGNLCSEDKKASIHNYITDFLSVYGIDLEDCNISKLSQNSVVCTLENIIKRTHESELKKIREQFKVELQYCTDWLEEYFTLKLTESNSPSHSLVVSDVSDSDDSESGNLTEQNSKTQLSTEESSALLIQSRFLSNNVNSTSSK